MNPLQAASRCVKCGLCLPVCPTFRLSGNEADSPRGRVTLIQALLQDEALCSPGLLTHIDRCLQCGACQAMCPSNVAFTALMDAARDSLEARRRRTPAQRLTRRLGLGLVAGGGGSRRLLAVLLSLYRRSGLQRLARQSGLLRGTAARLDRALARTPRRFVPATAAQPAAGSRGTVQLFTGCLSSLLDGDTLDASIRVLERLGYQVGAPAGQGCCGALHRHNGDGAGARRLARANGRAFAGTRGPVLGTSSACTAQLLDVDPALAADEAGALAGRVTDILHFLCEGDHLPALALKPLPQDVWVHLPCSQRNLLKDTDSVWRVLQAIPGIRLRALNPGGGCCGGAGSYFLGQPQMADRLLEETLAGAEAPGLVVTTNLGCALQLAAGAKERGWPTEVLHPVVLLARQLPIPDHP
ncbi:MAG TPA: (Fe-S)-binding protein [Gammaproteobacteria bacterium]|nr:(Fe-S)-binding protein [Gammaproteobacteria bacterium]